MESALAGVVRHLDARENEKEASRFSLWKKLVRRSCFTSSEIRCWVFSGDSLYVLICNDFGIASQGLSCWSLTRVLYLLWLGTRVCSLISGVSRYLFQSPRVIISSLMELIVEASLCLWRVLMQLEEESCRRWWCLVHPWNKEICTVFIKTIRSFRRKPMLWSLKIQTVLYNGINVSHM